MNKSNYKYNKKGGLERVTKEFYNHETKLEFLETIENSNVRRLSELLFERSKNVEQLYQKDLYSFSLSQIEEVMKSINPATKNSSANSKSRINTYISWAIKNGRRNNNINPLHGTSADWDIKFIDRVTDRYLSETDVHDIIDDLLNAQDKALILCIFEGISGRTMSELISMNINNIDWDANKVTVTDIRDNAERDVVVSDKCLQLIKEAYEQKKYLSEKTGERKNLIDCDGAIFKKTKWKNTKGSRVSRNLLARRLYLIKEQFELDELSVNTISRSGQIKLASDLYKKNGKLEKEEFSIIGDQFNLRKITANNYTYYNTSIIKHYVNKRNLKELYGLEVEL